MHRGRDEIERCIDITTSEQRCNACQTRAEYNGFYATQAILAGADFLVVGRPITDAANPRTAAQQFLAEMQGAFSQV